MMNERNCRYSPNRAERPGIQERKEGKKEMSYQPSEASKEKLLETERFEKIDSIVNHILEEIRKGRKDRKKLQRKS